jgi:GH15 family glucan-1,4-alpha-glucosidase
MAYRQAVIFCLAVALLGSGCSGCDAQADDACIGVDCSLHGSCRVESGAAVCECDQGFVALGLVCHADWCAGLACLNGDCIQNAELGACRCQAGWDGELCNTCAAGYHSDNGACLPDQPCDSDPCVHGVCRVTAGTESCDCDAGYAGALCDGCADGYHPEGLVCLHDQPDPCNPNPCNAAHRTQCSLAGDSYVCGCDPGYHDQAGQCLPDQPDPCDPNPCNAAHRTQCAAAGDSYVCDCDSNYHDDGGACLPDCELDSDLCGAAHASNFTLVSANGHGAVAYDLSAAKANTFTEHLYRNFDENKSTRNLLYDSYLGMRTAGQNSWLDQIEVVRAEYLDESGIIHIVQQLSTFTVDSYLYAPWKLSRPAMVLVGRVTNTGDSSANVSLYSLHNYHLGSTSGADPVNPGFDGERIVYQSTSGAYLESGPAGLVVHRPLGTVTHHGCTPDNPWQALQAGLDLSDDADSGVGDDRVAGFQKDFQLAPGQTGWFGVVSAFDGSGDQYGLLSEVEQAYQNTTAEEALTAAVGAWEDWRNDPPAGLSAAELLAWRQSEAILRQGQVWETSELARGQIVASLPPGAWNICWVRDMAYSIVALVRSGHLSEARAALSFVLAADSGYYQDYVGVPYQVSVTRYFGRGKEESDSNADGPNIEFDGFGLFLWALGEYVAASGDSGLVDDNWITIRDRIAGALVSLVDPASGLISADSSIWEVHWNGNQKRYSFSSLAAASGLCRASAMAHDRGDDALADTYRNAAVSIRDALAANVTDGGHVLASSYEELTSGGGYHDMAVVEALNFRLFDPSAATAAATLDMFDADLRVADGFGFFRNDDGGWYDSQEWVFTDLRAASGFRLAGRTQAADRLLDWITAQALFNHGLIAELHDPTSGDYLGEIPMVGFGAGAYMMALLDRQSPRPVDPACGSWESQ